MGVSVDEKGGELRKAGAYGVSSFRGPFSQECINLFFSTFVCSFACTFAHSFIHSYPQDGDSCVHADGVTVAGLVPERGGGGRGGRGGTGQGRIREGGAG